jgi:hypothetical protein
MSSGASSEATRSFSASTRRTSSTGLPVSKAISSGPASGTPCISRWRCARRKMLSSLMTCTGRRMVRDWFMIARSMFWRIHQVA